MLNIEDLRTATWIKLCHEYDSFHVSGHEESGKIRDLLNDSKLSSTKRHILAIMWIHANSFGRQVNEASNPFSLINQFCEWELIVNNYLQNIPLKRFKEVNTRVQITLKRLSDPGIETIIYLALSGARTQEEVQRYFKTSPSDGFRVLDCSGFQEYGMHDGKYFHWTWLHSSRKEEFFMYNEINMNRMDLMGQHVENTLKF